jgi:RNase H-fold protein (predicted Holliday junction resolvase)
MSEINYKMISVDVNSDKLVVKVSDVDKTCGKNGVYIIINNRFKYAQLNKIVKNGDFRYIIVALEKDVEKFTKILKTTLFKELLDRRDLLNEKISLFEGV